MAIRSRSNQQSRAVLAVVALACMSASASGCSGSGAAEQLQQNAPVVISTKANTVMLQNRAGGPVNDVQVTVVAFGGNEYSAAIGRIESQASRPVLLAELSGGERGAFNPQFNKPRTVRVRATDAVGKAFDVEVPWK